MLIHISLDVLSMQQGVGAKIMVNEYRFCSYTLSYRTREKRILFCMEKQKFTDHVEALVFDKRGGLQCRIEWFMRQDSSRMSN